MEELRPCIDGRDDRSWLQWGHGDEAVEELRAIASTGIAITTLQWGHGDEAVEEHVEPTADARHVTGFNGATAMKPWKRARPPDRLEQKT